MSQNNRIENLLKENHDLRNDRNLHFDQVAKLEEDKKNLQQNLDEATCLERQINDPKANCAICTQLKVLNAFVINPSCGHLLCELCSKKLVQKKVRQL